ncbi:MAG: hypothetical protein ABJA02_16580 [Acidobacteriota bacterium]
MDEIGFRYDVTPRDLARGRNLKIGMWSAPFVLGGVPSAIFFILMFIFGVTPPAAAVFFFFAIITGILGFAVGLGLSGYLAYRRNNWTKEMRERIAADGIRAEEIEWFTHELRPAEKRGLREISKLDLMLADAYRETLASRLTATRIVRSSRRELQQMNRRQNKVKQLKTANAKTFQIEIAKDVAKIENINAEARTMLVEAETRLQMIEAAAVRGSSIADSELVLKKLSARASELPLALEEAKMAETIRAELDSEDLEINEKPALGQGGPTV